MSVSDYRGKSYWGDCFTVHPTQKGQSKSNNILPRFPYKKCIVAVTKGYSSVLVVAGPAELYLFQVFLIIECKSVSV